MRRLIRFFAAFISKVSLTLLRAIVLGVIFTTFAMVLLHSSGLRVPVLSDLLDKLDGLDRLTSILSK